MHTYEKCRWKGIFEFAFKQHYKKLLEEIEKYKKLSLSDDESINKIFILFQKTFESGIKTIKEYLEYQGIFQEAVIEIIKEAFYVEIVDDGQAWIDIMFDIEEINKSHPKDFGFDYPKDRYLKAFEDLIDYFEKRMDEE